MTIPALSPAADFSADAAALYPYPRPGNEKIVDPVEEYAIFTMDRAGVILDWSRGAESIMGHLEREVVGRGHELLHSSEERHAGMPGRVLEEAANAGSYSSESWRVRRDGERFRAHITITALRSGAEVHGFVQITRDLTQRRLAIGALHQSEERFRLLVESVRDYAIFMLDPDGHVMSWNSGARRIKGYEPEEIIGRHFSIFYTSQAKDAGVPESLLSQALREGRAEQEGWRMRKDSTRFWGHVLITPLYNPQGDLQGFAKVTRDLTDQRQAESLREAGRRRDAFLATLAHELRNPLAPILPGVDIILRSADDPVRVAQVGEMLKRQVGQMARLIDDLVDISRITTGKIELKKSKVRFTEVMESALETARPMIAREEQVLETDVSPTDLTVDADPHRLAQMLSNLLLNASKYTPRQGNIRVTAAVAEDADSMLEVVVSDDGRGIAPGHLESIFDLFDQGGGGAAEGLGIGLTLVRSLSEMHGGEVTVRSSGEGRGSEFTLRLPVVVPPAPAMVDAGGSPDHGSFPLRVLVADDSQAAADIMALFFRMEGYQTDVVYDGEDAVAAARKMRPDVVVLDLGMPRLDGFEACARIRRLHPQAVIIALSGWGSPEDRRRSSAAGFDHHFVKPLAPQEMREFLSTRLKSKP